MTVEQTLGEVLAVHGLAARGAERRDRITELMDMVGLPPGLRGASPSTCPEDSGSGWRSPAP